MFETILSWPLAVVIPTLWAIAMLRANATYWIARGGRNGYRRLRTGHDESPTYRRAAGLVNRYGPLAVVFCFLTIGLQTAVLAVTGISRMPMRRFLPAVSVGALLWAIAYGTIGLAVVQAWVLAVAGSWWAAGALVVIALVIAAVIWRHRRKRRAQAASPVPASTFAK
ncbi:DedA family protein [Epidermidibacterium keratini]|uniref:DedA family protein n=1 Tax=Epidermidibacterium keratini TaxID=1891644 RepID=UPI001CEF7F52|nr:VTT domain-containing protein [Epidermidibacterium keratini]